jgi:glutaredoxin 3
MDKVILYSADWCSGCVSAKRFLESKNIPFEEINIDTQGISRTRLIELTGRLAIPTISVNGKVIGGYTELQQLYG